MLGVSPDGTVDVGDVSDVGDVVDVVAVVVAHDGARWLPDLLTGLQQQTHRPDVVVAADTGSADGSAQLLREALGADHVVTCDRSTGFGAAVAAALERAPTSRWVWLLHDDCVPDPGALAALRRAVAADPTIAVAGPKVRALSDRPLLLEVGVTIARSGRRETLLDRREYDQGQHDGVHDVLAVGSAGMLVRRDVWDQLGGFDPALPLLRDDVDLGWRARLAGHRVVCHTDAVVRHAEATARGARADGSGAGRRRHRLDRRHGAFVLLANLPLWRVPVTGLALLAGALVRALGYLLGKRPGLAADELAAVAALLARPDRLARARLARRRIRAVPARRLLPLLAPRSAGRRALGESLATVVAPLLGPAERGWRGKGGDRRRTSAPETGPTAEAGEDLPAWGSGLARRLLLRPGTGLVAALVLLALLAARGLLGDGRLMGGALLPAPTSGVDLLLSYVSSWHPVGIGSDTAAPPWLAVVGALGWLLGSAERAVTLLLLGAVPLAGLAAFLVSGRVVPSVPLRVWGATAYALLPPVVGAVATGRIGTALLAVLLPPAGLAAVRAVGLAGPGSNRAAWAGVLLLAVAGAFVPMVLLAVVVLALAALPWLRGWNLARLAALVLGPAALLLPWWPAVLARPALLLQEPGLAPPGLADADLDPLTALLLAPGGPGLPPVALTAGVLLAALAALLRPDRRRPVLAGWLVALPALAATVLLTRVDVLPPTAPAPVPVWPGPATLLAGAALVLAAVVGAEGARQRLAASAFGWRQPTAVLLTVLAGLGPVATAGWWVLTGADDPLERRDPVLLPAFVAAEGRLPDRPRTLVIRPRPDGSLGYTLLRAEGPRLGHAELSPRGDGGTGLDAVVADLASGRGGDAAARLVPYGVRFVLLTRPVDRRLARAVDAVPGIVRVSGPAGAVLWRVDYPTARLRVLAAQAAEGAVADSGEAPPPARVLPAGQTGADTVLPAGDGDRLLVLADPADEGWRARLDGQRLQPATYDGWAQAFRLPPAGGRLQVEYAGGIRPALLWLQLAGVVLLVVLALPAARTRDDLDREAL